MRHLSRHVHKTLVEFLKAKLATDGWTGTTINFGAKPVTFVEIALEPGDPIEPNMVGLSLGDRDPEVEAELGGLRMVSFALFVDVYAESASVLAALCDDIADALTDLKMPVKDYSLTTPADTSNYLETEDIGIEDPGAAPPIWWRVVSGTAEVYVLP